MVYLTKRFRGATLAALALIVPAGVGLGAALVMSSSTVPLKRESASANITSGQDSDISSNNARAYDALIRSKPMQQTNPSADSSTPPIPTHTSVTSTVSNGQAQVVINGQKIDLPTNGEVHKTINGAKGQTTVDINVAGNSQNQAGNSSSSSINLNVSSSSSSDGD